MTSQPVYNGSLEFQGKVYILHNGTLQITDFKLWNGSPAIYIETDKGYNVIPNDNIIDAYYDEHYKQLKSIQLINDSIIATRCDDEQSKIIV